MNSVSPRARTKRNRKVFYRCHVELLEERLPPGALWSPLNWAGFSHGLFTGDASSTAADLALVQEDVMGELLEPKASAVFGAGLPWLTADAVPVRDETAAHTVVRESGAAPAAGAAVFDDAVADVSRLPQALTGPSDVYFAAAGRTLAHEAAYGGMLQADAVFARAAPQPGAAALVSDALAAEVAATTGPRDQQQFADDYGDLPLRFEPNRGQTDAQVQFLARGPGYTLFLTATEAVLSLPLAAPADDAPETFSVVRMQVHGANPSAHAVGRAELPGTVNYFHGQDPSRWLTDLPTYGRVEFPEVYAGIDLVYYGNAQNQLEYDFVVAPGADPGQVKLRFAGADRLEIDAQGDLVLHTAAGALEQQRPLLYQETNGVRQEVAGSYVLGGDNQVTFQVGAYDAAQPLVIDPVLTYSTYLGGSDFEDGFAIAVDAAGSAYVTGLSTSIAFPTTAGVFQPAHGGLTDAFVSKLSPDGQALAYASYLGGEDDDEAHGITVDSAGNAYITGRTQSQMFPTTAGAFQTFFRGGNYDAFVTKIAPTGNALVYSSYLGGGANDAGFGIALGPQGNAYVAGGSDSEDFPTTANAYQYVNYGTDSFMTKLRLDGGFVDYSTFLGGGNRQERANSIAVDATGNAYVVGQTGSDDFTLRNPVQSAYGGGQNDGFCYKIDPSQSGDESLIYSTYLGGSEDDRALGVAVDAGGNAYVAGFTKSTDYATTAGAFQPAFGGGIEDAFLTKLNAAGDGRVYSTYLGGAVNDRASAVAVNAAGEAYLTGSTSSTNFPTLNPVQAANAGAEDAFVTKFNAAGAGLGYSTYLGGSGQENFSQRDVTYPGGLALDAAGNVYLVGKTQSSDFPTVNPLQTSLRGPSDSFVAKLSDSAAALALFYIDPTFNFVTAGTPSTLTVYALTADFQLLTSYRGEIFFWSTDPAAVLPSMYTYTAADMGFHVFPGVIFNTPGEHYLLVFDTATFQVFGIAVFTVT